MPLKSQSSQETERLWEPMPHDGQNAPGSNPGQENTETMLAAPGQRHYALAKLEEAARGIRQAISEMPALRKRLEKRKNDKAKAREIYGELQSRFKKLEACLNTASLSLLEMELLDDAGYAVKLGQSVGKFNLMTPDYSKLLSALDGYLSKLPFVDSCPDGARQDGADGSGAFATNAAIIGRMMNMVKMGYYPTDLGHIKLISNGVAFPENADLNLLDPCCGCGLALSALAEKARDLENCACKTYGIELDSYRAEEAQSRLGRVGFGSFFHSRISNEAFQLMLLNPPYLSVMTEGGSNTRLEKRFLVDGIGHLMFGGLLIYIVPFYRLTADVCRVLSDNFVDLTVWKFEGSEFAKFKQVAVLGVRRKRSDGSEAAARLSGLATSPDLIPPISQLPSERYALPGATKKVELFKGAQFNVAELAEQLSRSNSFSKLFEKSKLDSYAKRPLLPLNIGQVGLIGGSGLINGLVECDTPHIIKGRIVKEKRVRADENLNSKGQLTSTTLTEVISNKMVFNILTPEGFMSLTDYDGDAAQAPTVGQDAAA